MIRSKPSSDLGTTMLITSGDQSIRVGAELVLMRRDESLPT
jgi:hypothetical protein